MSYPAQPSPVLSCLSYSVPLQSRPHSTLPSLSCCVLQCPALICPALLSWRPGLSCPVLSFCEMSCRVVSVRVMSLSVSYPGPGPGAAVQVQARVQNQKRVEWLSRCWSCRDVSCSILSCPVLSWTPRGLQGFLQAVVYMHHKGLVFFLKVNFQSSLTRSSSGK